MKPKPRIIIVTHSGSSRTPPHTHTQARSGEPWVNQAEPEAIHNKAPPQYRTKATHILCTVVPYSIYHCVPIVICFLCYIYVVTFPTLSESERRTALVTQPTGSQIDRQTDSRAVSEPSSFSHSVSLYNSPGNTRALFMHILKQKSQTKLNECSDKTKAFQNVASYNI